MKIAMKQPLKSSTTINCLVVDDEPIARDGLMEYIRQIDYLHAVAECKGAAEAAGLLQKHRIDLIFIDIQMPKLTGIEFVKALADPPLIIFTTAYSQYAMEGFELDVVDYLLKPISFPRFLKAVDKAQSYLYARKQELSITQDFFFIKCNGKIEKITMNDVLYIEAMANYVIIHTRQKKYITYLTFSGIEEQLPSHLFIRIHKSYLVAISAIQTIDGTDVIIGPIRLPLSKNYRNDVMTRIESRFIKR
jgi:DNA-binding LytR/AlgR family response regulator